MTAFLTSIYSTRLLYLVFLNTASTSKLALSSVKENGTAISLALGLLSLCSIFNGYLLSEIFVGVGSDYFSNLIFMSTNRFGGISGEFLAAGQKNVPFFFSVVGIFGLLTSSYSQSLLLFFSKERSLVYFARQFLTFR